MNPQLSILVPLSVFSVLLSSLVRAFQCCSIWRLSGVLPFLLAILVIALQTSIFVGITHGDIIKAVLDEMPRFVLPLLFTIDVMGDSFFSDAVCSKFHTYCLPLPQTILVKAPFHQNRFFDRVIQMCPDLVGAWQLAILVSASHKTVLISTLYHAFANYRLFPRKEQILSAISNAWFPHTSNNFMAKVLSMEHPVLVRTLPIWHVLFWTPKVPRSFLL